MIDLARPFDAVAFAFESLIDQRAERRLAGDDKAL
jgi:hypothetical protein